MANEPEAASRVEAVAREVEYIMAENRRLLERLGESEQRFRLISRGVLRMQEAERGRIARELHDGLGGSLTALKIRIELLEQEARRDASPIAASLQQLGEVAERALQEVRQLSRLLRPPVLDDLGLLAALEWLARGFQEQTGIAVRLDTSGLERRLEPDVETLGFRAAQEALTNVAKHARAAEVRLEARFERGRLHLVAEDAGVGFDAEAALGAGPESGSGLRGLRDRAQLFEGRLRLASRRGGGTRLELEIPAEPAEQG